MGNKVRLTESQLKNIIKESVKTVLKESDWRTAADAAHKANYTYSYDMAMNRFEDFKKAARKLMAILYKSPEASKIARQLEYILIDAEKFCSRKEKQAENLDNLAKDSFNKRFGGRSQADMERHIDDLYDEHGWENMEDADWRKANLSPEDNEFYDYQ